MQIGTCVTVGATWCDPRRRPAWVGCRCRSWVGATGAHSYTFRRWPIDFRTSSDYDGLMHAIKSKHLTSKRKSSDLSKHSAEVFREAERHPVVVVRRGQETLVLMAEREVDARDELLDLAGRIVGAALEDGPLVDRLSQVFPWMLALSLKDREQCAQELIDAARAAFSTGQARRALGVLNSWRDSAEAIAAGLDDRELDFFDEPVPVERP